MITEAFGVPLKVLDKLKKIIQEPWEKYGDDDGPTSERLRKDGFWNDHIAVQAAIAVYKAPDPVTGLTDAQRERLEMLTEEAAEIVQCCTKILRHGYNGHHPQRPSKTNKKELQDELLQFWTIYERMAHHGEVAQINFYGTPDAWKKKLEYTHHQDKKFHHPALERGS